MKERKKLIIVLGIVFLILMIILLAVVDNLKSKQDMQEEDKSNQEIHKEVVEEYYSDQILPQGVSTLYRKYNGQNDKNDLYRSLSKMINYLPELSNDLQSITDDQWEKYFLDNSDKIKSCFGISDLAKFTELAKYLKLFNIAENQYQYCAIETSSYGVQNGYLTFNINITFENVENIKLKVHFANRTSVNPKVMYSVPN